MKRLEHAGFTPDDCAAFYRAYYAPNNATVVVVGDVRERELLLAIRNAYGAMVRQLKTALAPTGRPKSAMSA